MHFLPPPLAALSSNTTRGAMGFPWSARARGSSVRCTGNRRAAWRLATLRVGRLSLGAFLWLTRLGTGLRLRLAFMLGILPLAVGAVLCSAVVDVRLEILALLHGRAHGTLALGGPLIWAEVAHRGAGGSGHRVGALRGLHALAGVCDPRRRRTRRLEAIGSLVLGGDFRLVHMLLLRGRSGRLRGREAQRVDSLLELTQVIHDSDGDIGQGWRAKRRVGVCNGEEESAQRDASRAHARRAIALPLPTRAHWLSRGPRGRLVKCGSRSNPAPRGW